MRNNIIHIDLHKGNDKISESELKVSLIFYFKTQNILKFSQNFKLKKKKKKRLKNKN